MVCWCLGYCFIVNGRNLEEEGSSGGGGGDIFMGSLKSLKLLMFLCVLFIFSEVFYKLIIVGVFGVGIWGRIDFLL